MKVKKGCKTLPEQLDHAPMFRNNSRWTSLSLSMDPQGWRCLWIMMECWDCQYDPLFKSTVLKSLWPQSSQRFPGSGKWPDSPSRPTEAGRGVWQNVYCSCEAFNGCLFPKVSVILCTPQTCLNAPRNILCYSSLRNLYSSDLVTVNTQFE